MYEIDVHVTLWDCMRLAQTDTLVRNNINN